MSPRPGGEADKFGGRYEGAWTVARLLDVLAGRAVSLQVERGGITPDGVEFFLRRENGVEAHQVKRQAGRARSWTLLALKKAGVLAGAAERVEAGDRFHFISLIPSGDLEELADRARRSDDTRDFVARMLGKEYRLGFDQLCAADAWGGPERAWRVLRGCYADWPSERSVRAQNAALAELLFDNEDGQHVASELGDLVADNLGLTLDAAKAWRLAGEHGLRRAALLGSTSISERVEQLTTRWLNELGGELLRPPIARTEVDELVARFRGDARVLLLSAVAGAGKSAALRECVESLGWPALALRADRLVYGPSTRGLGEQLGLGVSPVVALAAVAQDSPALLVIDQLDAVSLASGRAPELLGTLVELVEERAAYPQMRVLMACRAFDLASDERLRALVAPGGVASEIKLGQLSHEEVAAALESMGLDAARLRPAQRELLRLPLHLVLLAAVADDEHALEFGTAKELFDAFWQRKRRDAERRREPRVRFASVVGRIAERMSASQRLSVALVALDEDDLAADAELLTSEHVLTISDDQVAFFHESFFDYAFARAWIARDTELVAFLLEGEQELFRRGQVRQVLLHLHDENAERFARELLALLEHPAIRAHIKLAALAVLGALHAPTSADWRLVERLSAGEISADRYAAILRRPAWCSRLAEEGVLDRWLADGEQQLVALAVEILAASVGELPGEVAALLADHSAGTDFGPRVRYVGLRADLGDDRALFDVVVEAVRAGHFDGHGHELFLGSYGMRDTSWGSELLLAYLDERPGAWGSDELRRLTDLLDDDHGLLELTRRSATAAPAEFCERLLPWLLRAMAATETAGEPPIEDCHFSDRDVDRDISRLEDALLFGAAEALAALARDGDPRLEPLLELLAGDRHDAAQWLLYEALRANGARYADRAADLLLENDARLVAGYAWSPFWTTRQLLQAISAHVSAERFAAIEERVLAFAPSWENKPGGHASFVLLSALAEERLSERGRRRLGELRRRLGEEPAPPLRVVADFVGSPIDEDATHRMNDEQWLRAMAKHAGETSGPGLFEGGARELANQLRERTKEDPVRFSRLAIEIGDELNPVYLEQVLIGLGETDQAVEPEPIFSAVEHAAASAHRAEMERWIPYALGRVVKTDVPERVIALVREIALSGGTPRPGDPPPFTVPDDNEDRPLAGLASEGLNSARGGAAIMLGNLLIYDLDGSRTALVSGHLDQLVADPHPAVRACVAHTLAGCLRHERARAVALVAPLLADHEQVLTAAAVERLIIHLAFSGDYSAVRGMIEERLRSGDARVRAAAGRLAAFAALEVGEEGLLERLAGSEDPVLRRSAAKISARRIAITARPEEAQAVVERLLNDDDEPVRSAAAEIAPALRERPLAPHHALLTELIGSPALKPALPQLLLTLEFAPDRVDELVFALAERFLATNTEALDSIATAGAGHSKQLAELVLRAYAQAPDPPARARALDLIDRLLELRAYGIADAVASAER